MEAIFIWVHFIISIALKQFYDVNNEIKGKSSKEIINVVLNLFKLSQNNKDIDRRVFRKSRSYQKTLEIEKKNRWSIEDEIIKRSKYQKLNK